MKLFDKINNMSVSEKTKEIYKNHLKKLNNDNEPLKKTFLNNTHKIKEKLDEMSIISQINFLSSIMTVLDKTSTPYKFYFDLKGELLTKRLNELEGGNKQRQYNDNIKDDQCKLIHEIMRYLPRRVQDFHLLRFYDGNLNPNFNYLAKRNGKYVLIFNNYKTSSLYNTQEFEFPSEVLPLLELYLTKPEVKSSSFLFGKIVDNKIQPYEHIAGLSQKIKNETGLTFNDLRHLYAVKHCKGLSEQIDEHLKKLAHSYNTNLYYQKT